MDKLKAIKYLTCAVEAGSFTAAAKSLAVSTAAVAQLIRGLERSLGVVLLHRTSRGLSLTADGERYYGAARQIAAELQDLEHTFGPRDTKPRGTLTVGIREELGLNCVMPQIVRFLASYPEVELVTKPARTVRDIDDKKLDLAVLIGWPSGHDFVVRPLARTRYLVCASPEYWTSNGRPQDPDELRNHHCLLFRSSADILLDRWIFEKNGERRTVDVGSRLLSDDRPWLDEAACAGAGVIRLADITLTRYLASGLLLPVLSDWEALEPPTVYVTYRRGQRKSKLVRVFVDFLVDIFKELERERGHVTSTMASSVHKPDWFGRAHGRQSAYVARRRAGLQQ